MLVLNSHPHHLPSLSAALSKGCAQMLLLGRSPEQLPLGDMNLLQRPLDESSGLNLGGFSLGDPKGGGLSPINA